MPPALQLPLGRGCVATLTETCPPLRAAGVLCPTLLLVPPVQARQGPGRPLLQAQRRDGKAGSLQTPQQLVTAVLHRLEPMGVVHGHRQGAPVEAEGPAVLRQAGAGPAGPLPAEPGHGARPPLLHRLQTMVQCPGRRAPGRPQHLCRPHLNTLTKPGCLHPPAHNHCTNSSTTSPESPTVGSLYCWKQGPQPMTSNTPPARPEVQPQATTTTAPAVNGLGRPPWLEPAVVVAVIGVAVTILGLLLSIAFGVYAMNARIDDLGVRIDDLAIRMDALGADLNARIDDLAIRIDDLSARMDGLSVRIDDLAIRIDALGADLNARIDDLAARMDTLGADLNARIDDLGADLNARIDDLAAHMDALGASLSVRIDDLAARMDALGASLSVRIDDLAARMDTLGASLSARIDALATRIDSLSARMDDLGFGLNKVYQLLLPKQS